jgi:GDP-4-dehydro-6-deoxy-D-mannose reductase
MRILVTGISGFIGCHLARELSSAGFVLHGVAKDPELCDTDVEIFDIDLLDEAGLERVVDRCAPDVVVHLAGLSHVGESWRRPGDYYRVNFVGTRNLLRVASGSRVIVASSAEVYGVVPESEQPIDEDRPLDPRSPYAMTKACAETLALEAGAMVVRAFNVVGAGQALQFAMPSFAAQLAAIHRGERQPVLRVGDLSPRRDFLHVGDAVAAYRVLIEHGEPGQVYNLASGEVRSIGEMLDRLRAISGVPAEVERDEERMRPVDVALLQGATSRLAALGWSPRRGVDQALGELWQAAIEPPAESRSETPDG